MGVTATYLVPSHPDQEKQAEQFALGLTVGSWTDIPHLEQQQLQKNKGQVVLVQKGEEKDIVKIFYPFANFSPDLPAILTTVYGKLSFFENIELIDLAFDEKLLAHFPGPRFGVNHIREQIGVANRPLLMAIFKGVLGRDIPFFANQLSELLAGGIDLIKDDEILFDNELTPFEKRITTAKELIGQHYEKTGQRALYAVNLSGRTTDLHAKAERAAELGANALLFNVHAYGLDALQALRENNSINLPIVSHPALSGVLSGQQRSGYSYALIVGALTRLVGSDFSLFPSQYGNVAIPAKDALEINAKLIEPSIFKETFAVPSAGISPGMVPRIMKDYTPHNLVINAGGGIFGHANGAIAGAQSFRSAIDAGVQNIPLKEAAKNSPALQWAIDKWGILD